VVQVRGRGDAYYRSAIVPPAEGLTGPADFDPLGQVLASAGRARVLAWMNVFFLWSGDVPPQAPAHVVTAHPEWGLRDSDGRPVAEYDSLDRALGWIEGPYADPASTGYREHFVAAVRDLVRRYPVAGVHLDFVRYPGPGYGQGGELGERFREAWGLDPRWIPEELRTPDLHAWLSGEMPPADRVLSTAALLWADLRASRVTALVRAVREATREVRPELELSAAIFPDAGPAYLEKGQDWRGWASEGLVDALFPMAYFGGVERVGAQLRSVARAVRAEAPRVQLWAGLGAYLKSPEEIARETLLARSLGYDGICLFDLGNLADKAGGVRAYGRSASRRTPVAAGPAGPGGSFPRGASQGGRWLAASLERATGGVPPAVAEAENLLEARWTEFESARGAAIPRVLARMAATPFPVPPAVELEGVFRYVHPLDPPERRAEQRRLCEDARARVAGGEDLGAVARATSQGGTRAQGGALGTRYVEAGSPLSDGLLATPVGGLTPVLEVANGYWFYRVIARSPAREVPLEDAPWSARRVAFRRALSAALGAPEDGALSQGGDDAGGVGASP
jgi:uncharacterized lipoprotein YddW (UPF0748 family)